MVDTTMSADVVLIGSRIEEADVKRLLGLVLREVDGVQVLLRIVIIITIASQSTQKNALIGIAPPIQREHQESLVDGP